MGWRSVLRQRRRFGLADQVHLVVAGHQQELPAAQAASVRAWVASAYQAEPGVVAPGMAFADRLVAYYLLTTPLFQLSQRYIHFAALAEPLALLLDATRLPCDCLDRQVAIVCKVNYIRRRGCGASALWHRCRWWCDWSGLRRWCWLGYRHRGWGCRWQRLHHRLVHRTGIGVGWCDHGSWCRHGLGYWRWRRCCLRLWQDNSWCC